MFLLNYAVSFPSEYYKNFIQLFCFFVYSKNSGDFTATMHLHCGVKPHKMYGKEKKGSMTNYCFFSILLLHKKFCSLKRKYVSKTLATINLSRSYRSTHIERRVNSSKSFALKF